MFTLVSTALLRMHALMSRPWERHDFLFIYFFFNFTSLHDTHKSTQSLNQFGAQADE